MANRALPTLPALFSAASTRLWLQDIVVGVGSSNLLDVTTSLQPALGRGFAAAPYEPPGKPKPPLQRTGLPPAWQPPPNNPVTLKPVPRLSQDQILKQIKEATTPLEVHNAYRRDPPRLPPSIAAAKFIRLAELLRAAGQQPPSTAAPAATSQDSASDSSSSGSSSSSSSDDESAVGTAPGVSTLLRQIHASWDIFLHLFSAADLATCVRASGELRALQPEPPTEEANQQAAGSAAAWGHATCQAALVKRSLAVLLEGNGRELAEAGPQAIMDVSYGLMMAGETDAATWRTLGPLLRGVQGQLPTSGATSQELAGEVLQWLKGKGL